MYFCLSRKGQIGIDVLNCNLIRASEMDSQKLRGADASGGRTILRGRLSSPVFLMGRGLSGLLMSGWRFLACTIAVGIPYIRSASVHPPLTQGSWMVTEGRGRALGLGALSGMFRRGKRFALVGFGGGSGCSVS
jgi:hypothetical protein